MNRASEVRVEVDLTPMKRGVMECNAVIDYDSMDRPRAMTFLIDDLSDEVRERLSKGSLAVKDVFEKPTVVGVLSDGQTIKGTLAFIRGAYFEPAGALKVECYLSDVTRCDGRDDIISGHWVFHISNYKINLGDEETEIPVPPDRHVTPDLVDIINGMVQEFHEAFPEDRFSKPDPVTAAALTWEPGMRNNRITFVFAGRNWTLDEDLCGRWPSEDPEISEPVRSGILATGFQEGDNEAELQQLADDISCLLSLALGRDIKWVQCSRRRDDSSFHSS